VLVRDSHDVLRRAAGALGNEVGRSRDVPAGAAALTVRDERDAAEKSAGFEGFELHNKGLSNTVPRGVKLAKLWYHFPPVEVMIVNLVCPVDRGALTPQGEASACTQCRTVYPIV